ncbi:MAG: hypothetical protein NZ898_17465, partial [Myxococcota bacterium]|nr:hypothetical protein [Myxococcota bacterium]
WRAGGGGDPEGAVAAALAGWGAAGGGGDGSADADAAAPRCDRDGLLEEGEQCDDGNDMRDDGCSPDCTLECGDGRVSGAEACDRAIAAGMPGACPTSCNDGDACTTDVLSGERCAATCETRPITMPMNGDGCCPAGATIATDSDCMGRCGDGVRTPPERCDTAIPSGMPDACPTSCSDGDACTRDVLMMGGTCNAR